MEDFVRMQPGFEYGLSAFYVQMNDFVNVKFFDCSIFLHGLVLKSFRFFFLSLNG